MKKIAFFTIILALFINVKGQENQIDPTLEVGSLPGYFNVSGSGAAVYTIPIDLPKARGGMTPNLAFVYNSQNGSGIMGKGWSLSGFSSIRRVNPTLYHNGKVQQLDFGEDDGYMLDGQRLIKIAELDAGIIEYRTEIDQIARVLYYPNGGEDNTDYWRVYTKSGITKDYGRNLQSRQYYSGASNAVERPLVWHITREIQSGYDDPNVNSEKAFYKISYEYAINDPNTGEFHPTSIIYNEINNDPNKTESPYYKVNFEYSTWLDENKRVAYYQFGSGYNTQEYFVRNDWKLDKVKVQFSNQTTSPLKVYSLFYEESLSLTNEAFLQSIQLESRGTDNVLKAINKTELGWEFYSPNYETHWMATNEHFRIANMGSVRMVALDINGDGKDDIAEYKVRVINDNWSFNVYVQGSGIGGEILVSEMTVNSVNSLARGDFNNDGRDELVVGYEDSFTIFNFEENNGVYSVSSSHSYTDVSGPDLMMYAADINGDGLTDCIGANSNGANILIGSGDESDYFINDGNALQLSFDNNYRVASVSDFTGDGSVEILTKYVSSTNNNISTKMYDLNWDFDNLTGTFESNYYTVSDIGDEGVVYFNDFNGDGKTDILKIAKNPNFFIDYYLIPSYGKSFVSSPMVFTDQPGLKEVAPLAADVNNDGRTDLVLIQQLNYNRVNIKVGFAKADGLHFNFKEIGEFELLNPNTFNNMTIGNLIFADLQGNGVLGPVFELLNNPSKEKDGRPDQDYNLILTGLKSTEYYASNVITSITDGFGVVTQIDYKPFRTALSETGSIEYNYPLSKYRSKLILVDQKYIEYKNGGKIDWLSFAYSDPVLHKTGKGFLGFFNTSIIDYQNNIKTDKTLDVYIQNNKYFFPYGLEVEISIFSSSKDQGFETSGDSKNQVLSLTRNTLDIIQTVPENDFVFFPVNTISFNQRWDANGAVFGTKKTIIDKNLVDYYGNIQYVTHLSSDDLLSTNQPESDYTFKKLIIQNPAGLDVNNWILNRIGRRVVSKWDGDFSGTGDMIIQFFKYYSKSHKAWPFMEQVETIPNQNSSLTTYVDLEYDSYGNIIKETVSAEGETPRETFFEYSEDYNGRFLTASWKTLDMVFYKTQYEYYEACGLLESITENPDYSVNSKTTQYFYDAFWNNNLIKLPNGLYHKSNTEFQNNGKFSSSRDDILFEIQAYTYSEGNEFNEAYWMGYQVSYFDKYIAELNTLIWDQNNQSLVSSKEYDDLGRLQSVENPHFESETNFLSTTFEYDIIGRPETVNTPGAIVKNQYNGLNQTVTNLSTEVYKTTTQNVIGQVKQVKDASGIISYDYYSSGNLKSTNTNGTISNYQYDNANRLTSQTEPDLGTYTYSYNNFGELIEQVDDKGTTTNILYDELGRVKEKYIICQLSETIKYTYQNNPEIYGLGLLAKEEVLGVNSYEYSYDALNRIGQKIEHINGMDFTHEYTYNPTNQQLASVEFPSGYSVHYTYRPNGSFHQVTNSEAKEVLWESIANNGMGQLTEYNMGNGITTTKEFDNYGYLTNITSDVFTQNLNYQFDPSSGNLLWRSSERKGYTLTENFTYDEKETNNRLMSWSVNNRLIYNATYAANGNIITKSDVTNNSVVNSKYFYDDQSGPHAVSAIESPMSDYLAEAAKSQTIIYNGYDKVAHLSQTTQAKHGSEYTYTLNFEYGANQARKINRFYRDRLLMRTKYYIGSDYEEEVYLDGNIRKLHYLSGGDGIFAIYVENTMKSDSLYYIHKDYQGNMESITSEQGQLLESISFDPWGRRRDANTWEYDINIKPQHFDRGYTLHEHHDVFGLINMNGRMYDPWVGRMLSPDPFVQDPTNTQNSNRYTYALNNPLKYTDPSGYTYKPADWDSGMGRGGAISINYMGFSAANNGSGYDFSGVYNAANDYFGVTTDQNGMLVKNTPHYDYHSGYYRDPKGNIVDDNEVFDNFVEPNSTKYKLISYLGVVNESVSFNPSDGQYGKDQLNLNIDLKIVTKYMLIPDFVSMVAEDPFANSKFALTSGGGLYGALSKAVAPSGLWLGKNGKYYSRAWGGNQYTGSRSGAIRAASTYKWAGRSVMLANVAIGGYQVYLGYQMDGGQFGYNAQMATTTTIGGIAGGIAGAKIGAAVGAGFGALFFGVGSVPGAVIGGFIGGVAGSLGGSYFAERSINYYYRR